MENIDHRNTLLPDQAIYEEYEFKYNFINTPWDDRTTRSKFGIILLLVAIFLATFACVINSFIMHYRHDVPRMSGFSGGAKEISCQLVKIGDYRYVARIHSLNTHELICIGAVVSETIVIANGACVRNTQVRLHVGPPTDIRCKNGFTVNTVETVTHEGVIGKNLVLLITSQSMMRCGKIIQFGRDTIQKESRAFVIGRGLNAKSDRIMSRQPVKVLGEGVECTCQGLAVRQQLNVICVKTLAHCPILAGDLLVQGGLLYGVASTSLYRQGQLDQVCFADLKKMITDLMENEDG